jgi:hypothetical protein
MVVDEEIHTEASHEVALVAKKPKPALEQGSTFPNPEPRIDKDTAPEVAVFLGTEKRAVAESMVKE